MVTKEEEEEEVEKGEGGEGGEDSEQENVMSFWVAEYVLVPTESKEAPSSPHHSLPYLSGFPLYLLVNIFCNKM